MITEKIFGIIPARGGSKGVPRKNIRLLAGKPLIAYTIDAAKGSRLLTRLIVSTDDPEISQIARSFDCQVIERPAELAQDTTPMLSVIQHTLRFLGEHEHYHPDITVILQPTAPLRTSEHIDEALTPLENPEVDSVVSVSLVPGHYNPHWQFIIQDGELRLFTGQPFGQIITRRQDLPATYTRNGAIYAFRTSLFGERGTIYGDRCLAYVMPFEDSVNIDSEQDLWLTERFLSERTRSVSTQ
jgi:CMP-N-acetylneuraminic acid synthetase